MKANEVHKMTDEEIDQESQFRKLRRDVARMLTEQRKRELKNHSGKNAKGREILRGTREERTIARAANGSSKQETDA